MVSSTGGFEVCSSERKWSKVARRMGFPQGKGIGSILKNHYEKILYRYDIFKNSGADNKETVSISEALLLKSSLGISIVSWVRLQTLGVEFPAGVCVSR